MTWRALSALASALLCLAAAPSHAQTSQFKGWAAISKELSTRLAPKDDPLDLDQFIPAEDMEDLLGTWTNFGSEHAFVNGLPNSVNVVIWRVALSRFAASVGQSCGTQRLEFHPRFRAILEKLCAWPGAGAIDDAVLLDFWWSVMGDNAPEEEYVAWRDFFRGPAYRQRPAAETVAAMTLTITMNPYFLLHK